MYLSKCIIIILDRSTLFVSHKQVFNPLKLLIFFVLFLSFNSIHLYVRICLKADLNIVERRGGGVEASPGKFCHYSARKRSLHPQNDIFW